MLDPGRRPAVVVASANAWAGRAGRASRSTGATPRRLLLKTEAPDQDGLSPLVVAEDRTCVMRAPHGPAARAASQARELEGQMAAPLALARLRVAFLWQWGHVLFLSF